MKDLFFVYKVMSIHIALRCINGGQDPVLSEYSQWINITPCPRELKFQLGRINTNENAK